MPEVPEAPAGRGILHGRGGRRMPHSRRTPFSRSARRKRTGFSPRTSWKGVLQRAPADAERLAQFGDGDRPSMCACMKLRARSTTLQRPPTGVGQAASPLPSTIATIAPSTVSSSSRRAAANRSAVGFASSDSSMHSSVVRSASSPGGA